MTLEEMYEERKKLQGYLDWDYVILGTLKKEIKKLKSYKRRGYYRLKYIKCKREIKKRSR